MTAGKSLGWLHRAGHRLGLLRDRGPATPPAVLQLPRLGGHLRTWADPYALPEQLADPRAWHRCRYGLAHDGAPCVCECGELEPGVTMAADVCPIGIAMAPAPDPRCPDCPYWPLCQVASLEAWNSRPPATWPEQVWRARQGQPAGEGTD